MELKNELAIILKTFPYQERDKVCVLLTEHSGKLTALAKGAIHSRRFGGSLDTLACSRVRFAQKPNVEMARIEEASVHHEFSSLRADFDLLAAASFAGEFCLRLIEPHAPARDLFVVLSNFLFHLDSQVDPLLCLGAFLAKALYVMGYSPNLLHCAQCGKGSEAPQKGPLWWDGRDGGVLCGACAQPGRRAGEPLAHETLALFSNCLSKTFKDLGDREEGIPVFARQNLFAVLMDFVHRHVPGLPAGGFKSLGLLQFANRPSSVGQ